MQKEALEYTKKCDQCQRFALNTHQPGEFLNPLSSPWRFAQWGLDIVGPFPKAVGNKKYLLVGTDYFTKWVEVEPLANIRNVDAKKFLWKNIVTRFGVPTPSSQIMDFSSTTNPLGDTVVSWELQTNTPLRHTLKETDKLKLLTRS